MKKNTRNPFIFIITEKSSIEMLHLTNHAIHFRNQFNPIGAGGHNNVHTLFQMAISPRKKGVWRSQISWLFLIHYELLENQKKFFWFFTVFLGDLEGVGTLCPHSSYIQKPRTIRVKVKLLSYLVPSLCKQALFNLSIWIVFDANLLLRWSG